MEITRRQEEIIEMLCAGYDISRIAEKLVISPCTVRQHISVLYKKLGVRTHVHLVALYLSENNHHETTEDSPQGAIKALSKREQEVWNLYKQGLTSIQVGNELNIAGSTVRGYLKRIRVKLQD